MFHVSIADVDASIQNTECNQCGFTRYELKSVDLPGDDGVTEVTEGDKSIDVIASANDE